MRSAYFNLLGGAALCCMPSALSAKDGAGYQRDDSKYLYAMTRETAARCSLIQAEMAKLEASDRPEWSRRHDAMAQTWAQLTRELSSGDQDTDAELADRAKTFSDDLKKHEQPLAVLAERARICEITSAINGSAYNGATRAIKDQEPDLFADFAAKKNQSGLDTFPEPPAKSIKFGSWLFESKGNSCSATQTLDDGAILTLGFTNFFDGSLKFEWSGLPKLDGQTEEGEEHYEMMMKRHLTGIGSDDDYLPIIEEGFTYENFPGTAMFVDAKFMARPFGEGMSDGQKYYFGAYLQGGYYNMLPIGKEVVVKVLGKETHRVNIDDPALWNEMSNCMAQYPYG